MEPLRSAALYCVSARLAGPLVAAPVAALNSESCAGHHSVFVPRTCTNAPACVQRKSNATGFVNGVARSQSRRRNLPSRRPAM